MDGHILRKKGLRGQECVGGAEKSEEKGVGMGLNQSEDSLCRFQTLSTTPTPT